MIEKYYHAITSFLLLIFVVVISWSFSTIRSNAFEEGRVVGHAQAAVEDAIRTMEVIDLCTKTTPKVYTVPDDIH